MVVALIAHYDCPEDWSDLLPFLLKLKNDQANVNAVNGALRCLALLSSDLDDTVVPTIVYVLFLCLYVIVSSSQPWMDQFSSILEKPVQPEDPDDWSIRMEILKCLNQFVQNFPGFIESQFMGSWGSLWYTFVSSLRVYEQSSPERLPRQLFDLVFDRVFELTYNWKKGSVFFYGNKVDKSNDEIGNKDESESNAVKDYAAVLGGYEFFLVLIDEVKSFVLIFDPGGGIFSTFSSFRLHHNSHVQNSLILMLMEMVLMGCYSPVHSLYGLNFLSRLEHILAKISRIAMVYTSMVLGYARIGVQYDYKVFQITGYNKEELKIDQNMYATSHFTFVVVIAYGCEKRTTNKCRKQKFIFNPGGGIEICSFLGCVVNSSFSNLTIDQDPHIQRSLACMLVDRGLMSSYSLVFILVGLSLMGCPRKNFIAMIDAKSRAVSRWNHIAWKAVKSGYCGKKGITVFDPGGEEFHDIWFEAPNVLSFCFLVCSFRYTGYAQCGKVRKSMVMEYSWWSFNELP